MDKNEERILELTLIYTKEKDQLEDEEKEIIKKTLFMALRGK